jgi:hypothetical protein
VIEYDVDAEAHTAAWTSSLVADQRFVQGRPDVLSFASDPLAEEIVLAGDSRHLFVSHRHRRRPRGEAIDAYPDLSATLPWAAIATTPEILRGYFR